MPDGENYSADIQALIKILQARSSENARHRRAASMLAGVRGRLIKRLMDSEFAAVVAETQKDLKKVEEGEKFKGDRPKKTLLKRPPAPYLGSGSVMGPPFDRSFTLEVGPGPKYITADPTTGDFAVDCAGGGGYTSVNAGIGNTFTASQNGHVRISAASFYSWSYHDSAYCYTADSAGFFSWYVYDLTADHIVDLDYPYRPIQLFSGHAGWLDDVSQAGDGNTSPTSYWASFWAYKDHLYSIINVFDVTAEDSGPGGGWASGRIEGSTWLMVFEELPPTTAVGAMLSR